MMSTPTVFKGWIQPNYLVINLAEATHPSCTRFFVPVLDTATRVRNSGCHGSVTDKDDLIVTRILVEYFRVGNLSAMRLGYLSKPTRK